MPSSNCRFSFLNIVIFTNRPSPVSVEKQSKGDELGPTVSSMELISPFLLVIVIIKSC